MPINQPRNHVFRYYSADNMSTVRRTRGSLTEKNSNINNKIGLRSKSITIKNKRAQEIGKETGDKFGKEIGNKFKIYKDPPINDENASSTKFVQTDIQNINVELTSLEDVLCSEEPNSINFWKKQAKSFEKNLLEKTLDFDVLESSFNESKIKLDDTLKIVEKCESANACLKNENEQLIIKCEDYEKQVLELVEVLEEIQAGEKKEVNNSTLIDENSSSSIEMITLDEDQEANATVLSRSSTASSSVNKVGKDKLD